MSTMRKVTSNVFSHKNYYVRVYRIEVKNTVHFETEICTTCFDHETGCTELVNMEVNNQPVNVTGNVSKYDAKSQCEYAMCALFTGKVYIDKYL